MDTIGVILFIPIFEYCVYPVVTKIKGSPPTALQKMGAGIVCVILSMVSAGFVEIARLNAPLIPGVKGESICDSSLPLSDYSMW